MKALDVDLRTPPRAPKWAWSLVGVLAVVAVVVIGFTIREQRKLDEVRAQVADLERQLAERSSKPAVVTQKLPYEESAREMLALATSKWPEMLTAFETAEVAGVTPSALEISPADRWIRVEVDFSDYGKLLEYIEALNAATPTPRWSLVQAQTGTKPGAVGGATSTATIRGAW